MSRNEAAERLRRRIKEAAFPMWPMAHVELREALDTRQRLTVERVHWANQWRDGGDHPNTPDIDDCGSCAYLLATADVDEEEPHEHWWVSDDGKPPLYCDFCGKVQP